MRLSLLFIISIVLPLALPLVAQAKTSVVIVQGLAGEDYYQRHFDEQVEKIQTASSNLVDKEDIQFFGVTENKESILPALQTLVETASSDDLILLYLIGHGSYDGRDYKFNIAGADISGTDITALFSSENLSATAVLINTSSSSGALLKPIAETGLHLITATKSGAERTATRFGRHFADGLLEAEADINKNESISLQEAFDYAERETQAFYDEEGLLATENPRMQMATDSSNAGKIRLASLQAALSVPVSSEVAGLFSERDELDRQIDTLRLRRINMTDDEYLQRFQDLMIKLSILQTQIDSEMGDADTPQDGA